MQRRGVERSLEIEEQQIPRMVSFLESQSFTKVERTPKGSSDFTAWRDERLCFVEIRVKGSPQGQKSFKIKYARLRALERLLNYGRVFVVLMSSDAARIVEYQDLAEQPDLNAYGAPKLWHEGERKREVREGLAALSKLTEESSYRVGNEAIMFSLKHREAFAEFAAQRKKHYVRADAAGL